MHSRILKTIVLFLCFASAICLAADRRPASSVFAAPNESYRLDISIDSTLRNVSGYGSISLKNTTAAPIVQIALRWPDKPEDKVEFSIDKKSLPLVRVSKYLLEAKLPNALAPGRTLVIDMRFQQGVRSMLEESDSIVISNWHPRLWWEGQSHASYDVSITAPKDVVVATSARLDPASKRYRADHLRNFGIFLGRGYQELEKQAGETSIRVVFLPSMRPCAELALRTAVDSVNFFRQRFKFYPQPNLTIVPGESGPWGGAPLATGLVAIHRMNDFAAGPESNWRWITAHEIGHQYWMEHVLLNESEQGAGWLMIGLGIWTDREFSRTHGLEDEHPNRLKSYALSVRSGINTTIMVPPDQVGKLSFDYNSKVIHDKGFAVISALSAIVGADTFERIFQRSLREYAGRRLDTAEFRRIAEEESRQDLDWFFSPMLNTNDYASYEVGTVTKTQDAGQHVVRAQIKKMGTLALPVLVEAKFEDGDKQRQWTDRFADDQFLEFRGKAPLSSLTIDPDRELPLVVPPPNTAEIEIATEVMSLQWRGEGAKALNLYRRAVERNAKQIHWLKLGLNLFDGGYYKEALAAYTELAELSKNTPRYYMAVTWQGMVHDLMQERDQALACYREAASMPADMEGRHDQFGLRINRAWVEERLKTPFTWPR